MESQSEFLARKGVFSDSAPEVIEEAKKQYRQQYLKEKQKEFRETHIRKELFLTKKEFGFLKHHAEKHQIKLSRFIKNAAIAYLKNEYLLPDDTQVRNLELETRRIGNLMNQIVRHIHASECITDDDVRMMKLQLQALEQKISSALRNPQKVGGDDL